MFFVKGFLIAIAYSAANGGLSTLVGTGPNIFVKGFVDQYYTCSISFSRFNCLSLECTKITRVFDSKFLLETSVSMHYLLVFSCRYFVGFGYKFSTIVKSNSKFIVTIDFYLFCQRLFRWQKSPKEKKREQYIHSIIRKQYRDLKSLSWQETVIIILFIILISLWIIRDFSDEELLIVFEKEFVTN